MRKFIIWLSPLILSAIFLLDMQAHGQYAPPSTPSSIAFAAAGKSSWLAASGTSAAVALSTPLTIAAQQVQVFNTATTAAFVQCGASTVTASAGTAGTATSDIPIAPGSVVVITPPAGSVACAAVLVSGTGAVYFTPGVGL